MSRSNPDSFKTRFNVKDLTKSNLAKTRERREKLNEKNSSAMHSQTALQRIRAKENVSQAILDARTAGETLDDRTAPTHVKNAAIASLLALYHNNVAELRSPSSSWSFKERWEVGWSKIPLADQPMGAEELKTQLGTLFKHRANYVAIGYRHEYLYTPAGSSPRAEFWIYVCLAATENDLAALRQLGEKVFLPPSLMNMTTKIRKNLLSDLAPPVIDTFKYLRSSVRLNFPAESILALKAVAPEPNVAWSWAIEELFQWLIIHPGGTPTSTPGFPYNCTLRPDGFKWGPITAANEELLLDIQLNMKRILKALAVRIATAMKKNPKASYKELTITGLSLYEFLLSQAPRSDRQAKTEDLWPHIVWEQAAGNIKPVSATEIAEGKPDRAIYMSPAVMRFLGMRCSQELTDAFEHPSKMTRFSYAYGGADILMSELESQMYPETESLKFYTTPLDGSFCENVWLENAVVSDPDVKSMDMHIHEDYAELGADLITDAYEIVRMDHMALLFGALLRFLQGACQKPLILTNMGITWIGKHLNPSGGWWTYFLNQLKSCGMRKDFEAFCNDPCFKGYAPHFAHTAHGDDQRILFGFDPKIPNMASNLKKKPDFKLPSNDHRSLVVAMWEKHLKKVQKIHRVTFKPETTQITAFLSGTAYLGCTTYYAPEELFGAPSFVPARTSAQALFTSLWPKHPGTKNTSPHVLLCCRMYSSWYESAVVWSLVQRAMPRAYTATYKNFQKQVAHYNQEFLNEHIQPPFGALEEGFAPPILPSELPSVRDVFTWLTGHESTNENEDISEEEGSDLVGFDSLEEKEKLVRPERHHKKKKPEQELAPAEVVELPEEELGGFDMPDEPKLIRKPTTPFQSLTMVNGEPKAFLTTDPEYQELQRLGPKLLRAANEKERKPEQLSESIQSPPAIKSVLRAFHQGFDEGAFNEAQLHAQEHLTPQETSKAPPPFRVPKSKMTEDTCPNPYCPSYRIGSAPCKCGPGCVCQMPQKEKEKVWKKNAEELEQQHPGDIERVFNEARVRFKHISHVMYDPKQDRLLLPPPVRTRNQNEAQFDHLIHLYKSDQTAIDDHYIIATKEGHFGRAKPTLADAV